MLVAKVDKDGNIIMGPDGKPVLVEIPDSTQNGVSKEEYDKAVAKARAEEKNKLYDDIKRNKEEVDRLSGELEKRDKELKDRQLSGLPPDQQVLARMKEQEEHLARERGARLEQEKHFQQQIRQLGLVAYRERALRDVPSEVAGLVNGNSEEEIDMAANSAVSIYQTLESKLRSQLLAEHQAKRESSGYAQQGVPVPPPNPAYIPPQYEGGFPTPTNPLPVAEEMQPPVMDMKYMTSEEAVRSGRYGGELREQLHARLKGQVHYPGSLGSAPRHWSGQAMPPAVGHVQMPGGVMQPQGTPVSAPMNPQVPQNMHRQNAEAAIARTHAGGNPVVAGDPAAANALAAAQAHGQHRGVNPKSAFSQRFNPTPPITSNGQG